jgi:GTP1/Obg family GTP-binding protein
MTPERLESLRKEATSRYGTVWEDIREMLDYITQLQDELRALKRGRT